ncbi:MAG: adenosyl-hopene transferase HpnH [Gammaproteobacteria bacterium]|nr:MAG: adenosyl-hopene transferase HpnH [Gammaproteobacteria bacterium]
MGIPLLQQYRVGKYLLTQKLRRRKRYPLVLMLEPLFQCNLACAGCGKIDYPDDILRKRISVADALAAVDECDAPIVSIPGGEPLIHKDMPAIVRGIIARRKFVYLCTNALLLSRKIDLYEPSPYLTLSIHLDGDRTHHDASVCQDGVFDKAVTAIRLALERGFRVNVNCTLFSTENPQEVADFFDFVTDLGVEGITVSPGYEYQHAPRQDVFLGRRQTKRLFRKIFTIGRERRRKWPFNHSGLYLDFLAGNRSFACTPWSNPTYNVFGWQKPCYLLVDEGYASSFTELLETTEWHRYGTGHNAKCNNCMAHCGYEGTAVEATLNHPLTALQTFLFGPRLTGPMAPELPYVEPEGGIDIEVPLDQITRARALDGG